MIKGGVKEQLGSGCDPQFALVQLELVALQSFGQPPS